MAKTEAEAPQQSREDRDDWKSAALEYVGWFALEVLKAWIEEEVERAFDKWLKKENRAEMCPRSHSK